MLWTLVFLWMNPPSSWHCHSLSSLRFSLPLFLSVSLLHPSPSHSPSPPHTYTHTHTHTTSIIGTPTTAQWPVESSITVDQFVQFKAKPWLQLLPEASDDAQDLLSVCHSTLEGSCHYMRLNLETLLKMEPNNRAEFNSAITFLFSVTYF